MHKKIIFSFLIVSIGVFTALGFGSSVFAEEATSTPPSEEQIIATTTQISEPSTDIY